MKDTWARNEISKIWSCLSSKLGREIYINRRGRAIPVTTYSGGINWYSTENGKTVDIAELLGAILEYLNLDIESVEETRKFRLVERNKE